MSFYALTALINAITSTVLGLFVYFKNKSAKTNQAFALFCLSTTVWSYAYCFWQLSNNADSALFWSRVLMAGAIFITISYFYFVLRLLNKINKGKKILIFGFLAFSFFFLANFTSLFVEGVRPKSGFAFWPDTGVLFHPFILIWFFYAFYAIYLLFKSYFVSTGIKRNQIRYILIGTVIGYLGGATNYLLWYDIPIPPIGNWTTTFYLGIVAYAIVKYELMDIRVFATHVLIIILNLIAFAYIFISKTFGEYIIKTLFFLGVLFVSYLLKRSFDQEVKQEQELKRLARKLEKANRKLKQLDRAKSEFISIASHQLRTPLGAIKGFVSLLLEGSYGEVNEKAKEALEKISTSNERLIVLVNDLLNLSRIEAGKMQYDFDYWQIEDIVQEIKDTLLLKAKEKGLYLKVDFPSPPLPKIRIDGAKIKEVISNLVENAVKYTKQGGVKVGFKQRENLIRIIVSDTGVGISQDEMVRLFSKFSRGKNISRLNANGAGLGLFVGRKIVEAHKGKIWAESEGKGKGSRFIVEIPINLDELKKEKERRKVQSREVKKFVEEI